MNLSFWDSEIWQKTFDVVIAGAGITGLSTAFELKSKNPALEVLVIDRGILPAGGSTKNAGFTCFGSLSELSADFEQLNEDEVFNLVKRRYDGLQNLRMLIGENQMDYIECGGFEVFRNQDKDTLTRSLAIQEKMNAFLYEISNQRDVYRDSTHKLKGYGFEGFDYMIENRLEGQIHTGKMMQVLREKVQLAGVSILMNTELTGIEHESNQQVLVCSNMRLKARKVVVTTNAFASQVFSNLDVVPGRAQVLITSEIEHINWNATFHLDEGYFYFRNVGKRLLLGGGRNVFRENETTYEQTITDEVQELLEQILNQHLLPGMEYRIEQRWAGTLGLGSNRLPLVEEIKPGVFAGVRLGGMGVAIGSLLGKELAEMVHKTL